MGKPKPGKSDKDLKRPSAVDPASRPLEWKIRAFDAAARMAGALEMSRDHRESIRILLDVLTESLGIGCQAVYLDEAGTGDLRLLRCCGAEPGTLPESIGTGSAFVEWLGRSGSPKIIESFFHTSGELTESELYLQDAFVRAGTGSACALKFGSEVMGIYIFGSGSGEECRIEEMHAAVGLMTGIAAAAVASQLISVEAGQGAEARERARAIEFRAVRSAVLEKTAADLETSLGVLKSGLWSIDPDPDNGSVMIDMARDAAVRLGAKVGELISLSGIEPAGSDLELEEVDMADIVEDITREMIADFDRKELVVAVEDRTDGRMLRADSGKLAYVVRSVIDHVMQSTDRGGTVDIAWSAVNEGPDGDNGPWFVLRVSGDGRPGGNDAIEAILDSLAAEHGEAAGPPVDSGLTLSEYILESHGGRLVRGGDDAGGISVWLPLGY